MKKKNQTLKLFSILAFLFITSFALTLTSFANETIKAPTIKDDEFLFVNTRTQKIGVGDVGGKMMIDFPTYFYSSDNILTSHVELEKYTPKTKVIFGSGYSIGGTAGGGVSSGLIPYDTFFEKDRFYVDEDYTVYFYMNNAWRTVRVGETWQETIEKKAEGFTGKFEITFSIKNYGLIKKSNLILPTPRPTPTQKPQVVTETVTLNGYVSLSSSQYSKNDTIDVSIPELGISTQTNSAGYYEIKNIPKSIYGMKYSLKIFKERYLTRAVSNLELNDNTMIGTTDKPLSLFYGDTNNDNAINMLDIIIIAKAFNCQSSDTNFNKLADLNNDGSINMSDVIIIAVRFGLTTEDYSSPTVNIFNTINTEVDDAFNVELQVGGFTGLDWKYTIRDTDIVKFESQKSEPYQYPDAFSTSTWTFKATSPGSTDIVFTPSFGYSRIYRVSVAADSSPASSPTPTSTPTSHSTPTPTKCPSKEVPVVNSTDLKQTTISTDPEQIISSGKNIVYCPTFQMAWNQFKGVIGGDISLSSNTSLTGILNKGFKMENSLSPESYVAMAGFGQSTVNKINEELSSKFKDQSLDINVDDSDIVAYSYLEKNLEFAKEFEVMDPISFKSGSTTSNVKAFGIKSGSSKSTDLAEQVKVHDYRSKDDFIVKLTGKSDLDEIILAKVNPEESIFKTYSNVMDRINSSKSYTFSKLDSLSIPVLDFNIAHNYKELEGSAILNKGFEGYFISTAYQRTRFKLDEKGALLASEALIIGTTSIREDTSLIFDKPFMIIMKEKGAENPYLMIWVNNPELLVSGN